MSDNCECEGLSCCEYVEPKWYTRLWQEMKQYLLKIKWLFVGPPKSNTILHAERELKILGYDLNDKEEGPNKWIVENIMELLKVFCKQGHSGSSAPYCIRLFSKLALQEPVCPITCEDSEWNNIAYSNDREIYQNNRCSAIFKEGKDGKPYYLDAITWKSPNGSCWHSTVEGIGSAQTIKNIPFIPKTFVVDVYEHEVAKDDWEFTIKDKSQLIPVFEYYEQKTIKENKND